MADNFSQSASEAIASGRNVPSGWYSSPDDPHLAQYWDGKQWVGETRSFESLNNEALRVMTSLMTSHSVSQEKILRDIRKNTTVLALLALLSAVGGFLIGISIASSFSG